MCKVRVCVVRVWCREEGESEDGEDGEEGERMFCYLVVIEINTSDRVVMPIQIHGACAFTSVPN